MPTQQTEARKNFIGIVSDTVEDERLALEAARSRPRVLSYLVDRLAAVLRRRGRTMPGPRRR